MIPASPSLIGAISLRIGPRMMRVGTRPRSRRRARSKPSPRSPLSRSKRRKRPDCPRVYCPRVWGSWMPATAMIPAFERSTALGMSDVAGVGPNTSVGSRSVAPMPPPPRSGRGRPQKRLQRDAQHQPISVKALALSLPGEAWQTITWREGTADWLSSRFARCSVRPAHRDNLLSELRAEEWLLIEWPEDETEPTKYWFSTLPEDIAFDRLVDATKLRWRIERDYQELKQELGLGDYEGRGWRGFHHHATLCIAAYGFLIAERGAIPPSGP